MLRYPILWKIASKIQAKNYEKNILNILFFGFIHQLRTRSRAVTFSLWTSSLANINSTPINESKLLEFISLVDAVGATDSDWGIHLSKYSRAYCIIPTREVGISWRPASDLLFDTIRNTTTRERNTVINLIVKFWVYLVRSIISRLFKTR